MYFINKIISHRKSLTNTTLKPLEKILNPDFDHQKLLYNTKFNQTKNKNKYLDVYCKF